MQYLFKTRYNDDIKFLAKTGEKIRVVAIVVLCLIAAPLLLQDYYLAELGLMLVYAIAGVGLMILTGHTGQVSFGHAAFLGIGAYTHSVLMSHGVPFLVSIPTDDSVYGRDRHAHRPICLKDAWLLPGNCDARFRHSDRNGVWRMEFG